MSKDMLVQLVSTVQDQFNPENMKDDETTSFVIFENRKPVYNLFI